MRGGWQTAWVKRIAVEPQSGRYESLRSAVEAAGAEVVSVPEADALVWADPARSAELGSVVDQGPSLSWVALPFAGIEPYLPVIRRRTDLVWTCARDVYSRPVAEHAIALATAGLRHVVGYARETSWAAPVGRNLVDGNVTIFGAGGITAEVISLLQGWNCDITVVRRTDRPVAGADRVLTSDHAVEAVRNADAVILALSMTDETRHIIDADVLGAMPHHSWLVNVARGGVIDTDALIEALVEGSIGGAALDVTDPEPLPEGHPLWGLPNVVITPHVANTPEMGIPLLARFIERNVATWLADGSVDGVVDPVAGY